jgi:hypothetical protein
MSRCAQLVACAFASLCLSLTSCQVREGPLTADSRGSVEPRVPAGGAEPAPPTQVPRTSTSRAAHAPATGEVPTKRSEDAVVGEPKLEVWHQDGAIHLRLTNRSQDPVTVDGDLVLGMMWGFWDQNGAPLEDATVERPPGVPEPSNDPRKRLKTLQPGESVERTMRLGEPFRRFVVGEGTAFNPRKTVIMAYEKWAVLREPERLRAVSAEYYVLRFPVTARAIMTYLGARPEELGLYRGRLKAQCTIPAP